MLNTTSMHLQNGSADGIVKYVRHDRTQEVEMAVGYYAKVSPAPSEWGGGLSGDRRGQPVDTDLLKEKLEAGDVGKQNNKVATDLTFSPPKSVSIAALTTKDAALADGIREAWWESVRETMAEIEQSYAFTRSGKGGKTREHTDIEWAGFEHEDARPVDGEVDPQLHIHVLVMNQSSSSGKKVDIRFPRGHQKMMGAVARSKLAHKLQAKGIELRDGSAAWELKAISEAQIRAFSQRATQIEDWMRANGIDPEKATTAQREAATMATREGKKQISEEQQFWRWYDRAQAAGIEYPGLGKLAGYNGPRELTDEEVAVEIDGLREREDIFMLDALRYELMSRHEYRTSLELVDAAIERAIERGDLIQLDDQRIISIESLRREVEIIEAAKAMSKTPAVVALAKIGAVIVAAEKSQGFQFSAGQRQAVEMALGRQDRLMLIRGAAGAGKTTAMKSVVNTIKATAQHTGFETIAIAPSDQAKRELESAGAEINMTMQSFIKRPDRDGENAAPRFVILDEAGMVSARDMQALLDKLRPQDRILLVGDQRQLLSVDAGQPFNLLFSKQAVPAVEITEINRQKVSGLLELAQAFSDGRAAEAARLALPYMREIPKPGKIEGESQSEYNTRERKALAQAGIRNFLNLSPEEQTSTVVMCGTNETRILVNEAVRAELQRRGLVGEDRVHLQQIRARDLRSRAKAQAKHYHECEIVEYAGKRGRIRGEVVSRNLETNEITLRDANGTDKTIQLTHKFAQQASVYARQAEMPIALGDRVAFRAKATLHEGKVENGDKGKVVAVDKKGFVTVEVDRGKKPPLRIVIDPSEPVAIERGWARTVHSAQGLTERRAILVAEATGTNANLGYVATSRETHELEIVTVNAEKLIKSWSEYADSRNMIDVVHLDKSQKRTMAAQQKIDEVRELLGRLGIVRSPDVSPLTPERSEEIEYGMDVEV